MITLPATKRRIGDRPGPRIRLFRLGVALIGSTALILGLLAYKPELQSFFSSGEQVRAEFAGAAKLRPYDSQAKFAGMVVGTVTDVERTERGTALVTMKINDDAAGKLGSRPSARIEPRTALGGRYTVDLVPGGSGDHDGAVIPLERTGVPTELDRVLEALPADTRESLRQTLDHLDKTLDGGGKDAVRGLVRHAPDTLRPAGDVLSAARGTRPATDLREIVGGFSAVADTLTAHDGQLDDIVTSLNKTSGAFASHSDALAATIATLPGTLRDTRAGMTDLGGTVDRLTTTAKSLRPTAPELARLMRRLKPVLVQARPLLRDLRPLLHDAEPVVRRLVPVAEQGTDVLGKLRGPVLDRLNGPVMDTLLNSWRGKGPYAGSGRGIQADHKFYEELGYLVTNIDRASMTQDQHGSTLGFQVGAGTETLPGIPFTLENLKKYIRHGGGVR